MKNEQDFLGGYGFISEPLELPSVVGLILELKQSNVMYICYVLIIALICDH